MPGYKFRIFRVFIRSRFRIIFISLLLGGLVFFIFGIFSPPVSGERYCILTLDKEVPDRLAGELISAAGFTTYYSESSASIYIDDFGRWKGFPLDQYRENMEPYDPRNDGYAEKLLSFFLDQGKRKFYIPLGESVNPGSARKKISAALGSIPFSAEIIGRSGPVLFWFILQFAAAICALGICRDKKRFALQLPVIMAFAYGGLQGIVLTAVLAGLREFLREPLTELFSRKPYGSFRERFEAHKPVILWIICFFILYLILSVLLNIPAFPVWVGFFCFIGMEFFSFIHEKRLVYSHNFFAPVNILPFRYKSVVFHQSIAVFALSALLGSLLFLIFPDNSLNSVSQNTVDLAIIPSEAEYWEHMEFQASFSFLPLGSSEGSYLHYFLGTDGLIAGTENPIVYQNAEIPPFPLEKLTRFLLDYRNKAGDSPRLFIKEWFFVALLLLLFIPRRRAVRNGSKKNKVFLLRYPRIAA